MEMFDPDEAQKLAEAFKFPCSYTSHTDSRQKHNPLWGLGTKQIIIVFPCMPRLNIHL